MIFVFLQQKLVDNGKSHRYTDTDHQQEAGGIMKATTLEDGTTILDYVMS